MMRKTIPTIFKSEVRMRKVMIHSADRRLSPRPLSLRVLLLFPFAHFLTRRFTGSIGRPIGLHQLHAEIGDPAQREAVQFRNHFTHLPEDVLDRINAAVSYTHLTLPTSD